MSPERNNPNQSQLKLPEAPQSEEFKARVSVNAFLRFEQRGSIDGFDKEDWLAAEQEELAKLNVGNKPEKTISSPTTVDKKPTTRRRRPTTSQAARSSSTTKPSTTPKEPTTSKTEKKTEAKKTKTRKPSTKKPKTTRKKDSQPAKPASETVSKSDEANPTEEPKEKSETVTENASQDYSSPSEDKSRDSNGNGGRRDRPSARIINRIKNNNHDSIEEPEEKRKETIVVDSQLPNDFLQGFHRNGTIDRDSATREIYEKHNPWIIKERLEELEEKVRRLEEEKKKKENGDKKPNLPKGEIIYLDDDNNEDQKLKPEIINPKGAGLKLPRGIIESNNPTPSNPNKPNNPSSEATQTIEPDQEDGSESEPAIKPETEIIPSPSKPAIPLGPGTQSTEPSNQTDESEDDAWEDIFDENQPKPESPIQPKDGEEISEPKPSAQGEIEGRLNQLIKDAEQKTADLKEAIDKAEQIDIEEVKRILEQTRDVAIDADGTKNQIETLHNEVKSDADRAERAVQHARTAENNIRSERLRIEALTEDKKWYKPWKRTIAGAIVAMLATYGAVTGSIYLYNTLSDNNHGELPQTTGINSEANYGIIPSDDR